MNGYLREAVWEDAGLLYQWANEKAVRKNSFHTEEISYEEHLEWMDALLQNKGRKQYIYLYGGEPSGQVRAAISGEEAELSYSIAPEKRGMGHARRMLSLAEEKLRQDFPEIKKLVARVKYENTASRKLLQSLAYDEIYVAFEHKIGEGLLEENTW